MFSRRVDQFQQSQERDEVPVQSQARIQEQDSLMEMESTAMGSQTPTRSFDGYAGVSGSHTQTQTQMYRQASNHLRGLSIPATQPHLRSHSQTPSPLGFHVQALGHHPTSVTSTAMETMGMVRLRSFESESASASECRAQNHAATGVGLAHGSSTSPGSRSTSTSASNWNTSYQHHPHYPHYPHYQQQHNHNHDHNQQPSSNVNHTSSHPSQSQAQAPIHTHAGGGSTLEPLRLGGSSSSPNSNSISISDTALTLQAQAQMEAQARVSAASPYVHTHAPNTSANSCASVGSNLNLNEAAYVQMQQNQHPSQRGSFAGVHARAQHVQHAVVHAHHDHDHDNIQLRAHSQMQTHPQPHLHTHAHDAGNRYDAHSRLRCTPANAHAHAQAHGLDTRIIPRTNANVDVNSNANTDGDARSDLEDNSSPHLNNNNNQQTSSSDADTGNAGVSYGHDQGHGMAMGMGLGLEMEMGLLGGGGGLATGMRIGIRPGNRRITQSGRRSVEEGQAGEDDEEEDRDRDEVYGFPQSSTVDPDPASVVQALDEFPHVSVYQRTLHNQHAQSQNQPYIAQSSLSQQQQQQSYYQVQATSSRTHPAATTSASSISNENPRRTAQNRGHRVQPSITTKIVDDQDQQEQLQPPGQQQPQTQPQPQTQQQRTSPSRKKRHNCWMCHKSFDRPSTLRKHLLVHTGEKAFACDICGRRFGVGSNLNRHMKRCALRPVHRVSGSREGVGSGEVGDGVGLEGVGGLGVDADVDVEVNDNTTDTGAALSKGLGTGNLAIAGSSGQDNSQPQGQLQSQVAADHVRQVRKRTSGRMRVQDENSNYGVTGLGTTGDTGGSASTVGTGEITATQAPRPKRQRRAPSPSRWIPESLRTFFDQRDTNVPIPLPSIREGGPVGTPNVNYNDNSNSFATAVSNNNNANGTLVANDRHASPHPSHQPSRSAARSRSTRGRTGAHSSSSAGTHGGGGSGGSGGAGANHQQHHTISCCPPAPVPLKPVRPGYVDVEYELPTLMGGLEIGGGGGSGGGEGTSTGFSNVILGSDAIINIGVGGGVGVGGNQWSTSTTTTAATIASGSGYDGTSANSHSHSNPHHDSNSNPNMNVPVDLGAGAGYDPNPESTMRTTLTPLPGTVLLSVPSQHESLGENSNHSAHSHSIQAATPPRTLGQSAYTEHGVWVFPGYRATYPARASSGSGSSPALESMTRSASVAAVVGLSRPDSKSSSADDQRMDLNLNLNNMELGTSSFTLVPDRSPSSAPVESNDPGSESQQHPSQNQTLTRAVPTPTTSALTATSTSTSTPTSLQRHIIRMYEERDSFNPEISANARPYHPDGWTGKLPGPGVWLPMLSTAPTFVSGGGSDTGGYGSDVGRGRGGSAVVGVGAAMDSTDAAGRIVKSMFRVEPSAGAGTETTREVMNGGSSYRFTFGMNSNGSRGSGTSVDSRSQSPRMATGGNSPEVMGRNSPNLQRNFHFVMC